MSTDIVLVHKDIADQYLQTLKQTVTDMQASRESLPVVVSTESVSRISALIQDATNNGGKIFHGGLPSPQQNIAKVIPTIIGGLNHDMKLWNDEAFGTLMGYRLFSDEEEAVSLANNSGYGLSASVFTHDLRKALAFAKKLETG